MDVDFSKPFLIAMMLGNKDHIYSNNLGIVSILCMLLNFKRIHFNFIIKKVLD